MSTVSSSTDGSQSRPRRVGICCFQVYAALGSVTNFQAAGGSLVHGWPLQRVNIASSRRAGSS
jgi:hypothetical protein